MKKLILSFALLTFMNPLKAQLFTNYTTANGLASNNVNCVDTDASDNIWFGTQLGVSVFDGLSVWVNYSTSTDPVLADDNITAIHVANNGDVWVGTDFGTSVLSSGIWTTYTSSDGLGNDQIKCIGEDLDGDIWFGTNNGASEFTGSSWTNYGTSDGLPFGGITTITTGADGTLWMGSGLGGVWKFNGSTFSGITTSDGLLDDRLRGIAINESTGKRWFGTSEGISVFNSSDLFVSNHTRIFTLPAPDTLNPVEDVKMDSQGNIWVGVYVDYLVTEGGVSAYNGTNWVEYHVSDGLIGPVVRALAVDGNDDVWVATSSGVSKIHDPSVGIENLTTEQFTLFPNPASQEINISSPSSLQDLRFYNSMGQEVEIEKNSKSNGDLSIRVDHLPRGIYHIHIGTNVSKVILR